MWHLELKEFFLRFDLVYDLTCPIFKLVWDFVKANILTKFHGYRTENWPLARRKFTTDDERQTADNGQRPTDSAQSQ